MKNVEMVVSSEPEVKVLKVTSIEDLKRTAQGELVELPSFCEEIPFVARLKRPSMLAMVKRNRIPNELLSEANKLFTGGVSGVAIDNVDPNMMKDLITILESICEEAFVEPTYKQLQDNGIELTDEQQMAVFSYTQKGIDSLKSFRK